MDRRGFGSSPALRRTLLAVAALFAALVAARLHGFSLPLWHRLLDGSPAPEVLLGEPRRSRWDDVVVQLPLNLAQRAHEPRFPAVNTDVGLGLSLLVPAGPSNTSPVAHPVALFRPLLWGFFLGDDVGLAWLWWGRLLGLFAVALGLAFALSGSAALSAAVAGALVFQPGFQLLGLNGAPHVIYAGVAWLAARGILFETRPAAMAAWALALGWAGACFALEFYPPFQVGLAWLFAFLLAGLVGERGAPALRARAGARLAALAGGGAIALASAAALAWEAREPIERLRATVYPGGRISLGGALELPTLFAVNLLGPLRLDPTPDLLPYAVGFLLLSPLVAAVVLAQAARCRPASDPLALALFCLALLFYSLIGVPRAIASATLLRFLPPERVAAARRRGRAAPRALPRGRGRRPGAGALAPAGRARGVAGAPRCRRPRPVDGRSRCRPGVARPRARAERRPRRPRAAAAPAGGRVRRARGAARALHGVVQPARRGGLGVPARERALAAHPRRRPGARRRDGVGELRGDRARKPLSCDRRALGERRAPDPPARAVAAARPRAPARGRVQPLRARAPGPAGAGLAALRGGGHRRVLAPHRARRPGAPAPGRHASPGGRPRPLPPALRALRAARGGRALPALRPAARAAARRVGP